MTRTDRLTLVRQMRRDGMSQRAIARRLTVSKDTVRRDFEWLDADSAPGGEPGDAPPPDPAGTAAPQAGTGDPAEGRAAGAPVALLPRRVAQPLDGVDLSQWPAVRRDLATLAQTGRSAEALAHQAITQLAHHYARALAAGHLAAGQPFTVAAMELRPLPVPAEDEIATWRSTPGNTRHADGGGDS